MRAPRPLRISEDFVPVSELKAKTADWLRRIAETDQPLVVTQNGRPAGVLLSPAAFDALTERAAFIAAIEEGVADADAGRTRSHADVQRRMRARFATRAE